MTDKQTIFIAKYLTHFNATRAAIEAGYSEETARQIASENLSKPDIKEVIDSHIKEIIAQTDDKRAKLIQFWIDVIDNDESSETAKMKASENLAKYMTMITEREELSDETTQTTRFVVEGGEE